MEFQKIYIFFWFLMLIKFYRTINDTCWFPCLKQNVLIANHSTYPLQLILAWQISALADKLPLKSLDTQVAIVEIS